MNAYIKFVCLSVVVLLATHTARSQQSNSLKIYFAENGVEHKLNNDFGLYIVLGDETGGTKGIYKAAVFDGNNIRLPEHDGVNYDFSEKCHIVLKYKGKCYYCFSLDRMMDLYLLQDRIELHLSRYPFKHRHFWDKNGTFRCSYIVDDDDKPSDKKGEMLVLWSYGSQCYLYPGYGFQRIFQERGKVTGVVNVSDGMREVQDVRFGE